MTVVMMMTGEEPNRIRSEMNRAERKWAILMVFLLGGSAAMGLISLVSYAHGTMFINRSTILELALFWLIASWVAAFISKTLGRKGKKLNSQKESPSKEPDKGLPEGDNNGLR